MLSDAWLVEPLGRIRVCLPKTTHLATIDGTWPARRKDSDRHKDAWEWTRLVRDLAECFIAVEEDDRPIGIWGSRRETLLRLPGGSYYRLDFLEADPDRRGGPVGVLTIGLAACRALELAADGMVLATFPIEGLRRFYKAVGAVEERARGWNCDKHLLPFHFNAAALKRLREATDELLEIT